MPLNFFNTLVVLPAVLSILVVVLLPIIGKRKLPKAPGKCLLYHNEQGVPTHMIHEFSVTAHDVANKKLSLTAMLFSTLVDS
jgi:hypothetical protein